MASLQVIQTPSQTVETYFTALRALDPEGYLACFAPDAQVEDPVEAPLMVGHEALRAFIGGITSLFSSLEIRPERVHICSSEAAVPWRAIGKGHNGAEVTCEGVDCFRFDTTGHFTHIRAYWNPGPVLVKVQA